MILFFPLPSRFPAPELDTYGAWIYPLLLRPSSKTFFRSGEGTIPPNDLSGFGRDELLCDLSGERGDGRFRISSSLLRLP